MVGGRRKVDGQFYLVPGVRNRKFYLVPEVRNHKIYLVQKDSYEKIYLAVKGLKTVAWLLSCLNDRYRHFGFQSISTPSALEMFAC